MGVCATEIPHKNSALQESDCEDPLLGKFTWHVLGFFFFSTSVKIFLVSSLNISPGVRCLQID